MLHKQVKRPIRDNSLQRVCTVADKRELQNIGTDGTEIRNEKYVQL